MKKIIYIIAIMALVASSAYSEKIPIIISNDAVHGQTRTYIGAQAHQMAISPEAIQFVPDNNNEVGRIPASMLLDPYTYTGPVQPFTTKQHPYIAAPAVDSSRILVSVLDPNFQWYFGDRYIPGPVGDQNGNIVYIMNGFSQFSPSLKKIYRDVVSGQFIIDSVKFSLYSYPKSPVKEGMIFAVVNFKSPLLGTANFGGISDTLDSYFDQIVEYVDLSAPDINAKSIPSTGDAFNIEWTTIDLTNKKIMNKMDASNDFGFLLFKQSTSNMTDSLHMIGAWEWTQPNYKQTFGGTIIHYNTTNTDIVRTLWNTVLPQQPPAWKTYFPTYFKEKNVRYDYTFIIYGQFDGLLDSTQTSVEVISNDASNLSLSQNYPNPVVDETNIEFTITKTDRVIIKAYNSVGQEVGEIANQVVTPGTYNAKFDASLLPSGTYYYSMTSGGKTVTRVMQIVR